MPTDEELFINDDLNNSPENRLNHVLFGLFLNWGFRTKVLKMLGVTEDAVIYKPTNVWGQERPDFAIESHDGRQLGYIEVEFDKDPGQLASYRANAERDGLVVFSFGREENDHNITLRQLVELAQGIQSYSCDYQFTVMVRHFAKQVRESEGINKSTPPGPVQTQLETPLGEALLEAGMVNWGDEGVRQGKLYGRSNGPHGISVRVYSRRSSDKTVGVLNIIAGRPAVNFASHSHLEEYLPVEKLSALDGWADFIYGHLGADIRSITAGQYSQVHVAAVENCVADLVEWLLPLA